MSQRLSEWPEKAELTRLIREAQCDGHRARETLLGVLRPHFVSFFAGRLTRDTADDLAQNALLRIAGALTRIDPERADSYVVTVARNLLRTAYRRRTVDQRRHADVDLAESPDARDSAEALVEYEDMVLAVHRVVSARLPAPLAEVVRGLLSGETPSEIAVRLSVSAVTIRTRLVRARAILRRELRPYVETEAATMISSELRRTCRG